MLDDYIAGGERAQADSMLRSEMNLYSERESTGLITTSNFL